MDEFRDPGVHSDTNKWDYYPNVPLVQIVDLHCRQHEDVYEWKRCPQGPPHLVFDETTVKLYQQNRTANHEKYRADDVVIVEEEI